MASNISYSPKEFKVLIKDQTTFGTSVAGSAMYQLDVDSISAPSLNNFQNITPRDGRTIEAKDFQQDRTLSVKELTFTGTMHNDDQHKWAMMSIAQDGTNTYNDELNIDGSALEASGFLAASTTMNEVNIAYYGGSGVLGPSGVVDFSFFFSSIFPGSDISFFFLLVFRYWDYHFSLRPICSSNTISSFCS